MSYLISCPFFAHGQCRRRRLFHGSVHTFRHRTPIRRTRYIVRGYRTRTGYEWKTNAPPERTDKKFAE
jgi:hypothetical protein